MMPTSKAGISKAEAFTLIEVLVALAIVSIALVGLLQLHLVSVRMADTAQATTLAVLLAQEKIAEIVSTGSPAIGTRTGAVEREGSKFQWRATVTSAGSLQSCGLGRDAPQQLCVDVTWRDGMRPRCVQMTTLISDTRIHGQN